MVEMVSHRDIAIDTSVYGMGRGAGNLNTEIFIDYLNKSYGVSYKINPLLEIIDNYLESLYSKKRWGFSIAHYLSAIYDTHPSYGSYLLNKKTLPINAIENLLSSINKNQKYTYNEEYIQEIYKKFQTRHQQKSLFSMDMIEGKTPLLLASGSSLSLYMDKVRKLSLDDDIVTIALNHVPQFNVDYYFFSNQKRYLEFMSVINPRKLIVGTNIELHTMHDKAYSIDYRECSSISENVTSLMLHFLHNIDARKVLIAGLDGFSGSDENYYYEETDQPFDKKELINRDNEINRFVSYYADKLRIRFVTPSVFERVIPDRILGVIPARYKSSRFEGKPLVKINGVEMIKRTYQQAKLSDLLDDLVVATDDNRIKLFCIEEGIPVMMSSESCSTGTDRLAEIAKHLDYDFYINIQGDEPVIEPETISQVIREYQKYRDKYIAYNLYKDITDDAEKNSSNIIKVVVNQHDELINMSRAAIPYSKDGAKAPMKKQVCVYGFTQHALKIFSSHNKTLNEQFEDIEILRFIDLGFKVKMIKTNADSIAVDIPDDVKKVEAYLDIKKLQ
jgi:3-deoxy-D-manno-octulosonate cytidylyltransferase